MNKKVDKNIESVRKRKSYTLINKNNAFLNALLVMQKTIINKIEKVKDSNRAY